MRQLVATSWTDKKLPRNLLNRQTIHRYELPAPDAWQCCQCDRINNIDGPYYQYMTCKYKKLAEWKLCGHDRCEGKPLGDGALINGCHWYQRVRLSEVDEHGTTRRTVLREAQMLACHEYSCDMNFQGGISQRQVRMGATMHEIILNPFLIMKGLHALLEEPSRTLPESNPRAAGEVDSYQRSLKEDRQYSTRGEPEIHNPSTKVEEYLKEIEMPVELQVLPQTSEGNSSKGYATVPQIAPTNGLSPTSDADGLAWLRKNRKSLGSVFNNRNSAITTAYG
ncbi:hypothetical protein B0O99DRAFT_323069 [Bisporella sp. PMI_857]|nr:hypothetical protein B0O99DRAFT_369941 [Bisporella sp. PMI_857]KAH8600348.1 hypothetical protein B0O99DRAFT_323069 [Bisporella sp. PMI_857]